MICCTKLVVRDCPICHPATPTGDTTNRDNPASSSTNTTQPATELRVREEELSKRQQDMKEKEERLKRQESKLEKEKREMDDKIKKEQENNNKQKATTTATSSSPSSDITEVTNKEYPDGLFTGFVKGSQRYKGTLVYHANNAKFRKEYTGDFVNGTFYYIQ